LPLPWAAVGLIPDRFTVMVAPPSGAPVLFTEDGARESQRLLQALFGRQPEGNPP